MGPKLYQGSIVWVPIADRKGHNHYGRPLIILVQTEEIESAPELFGVIVSNTSYHVNPRPHHYVEVPHHPQGLVCTKLKKPCVAVCNWIEPFKKSEIERYAGRVSQQLLEIIVLKIRELFGAKQQIALDSEAAD